MGQEVTVYERELDLRMPDIANVLEMHTNLRAKAFKIALLDQVQNSHNLRDCSPLSFCNAALTCATLGLLPQRTIGQFYLIPVRNKGVWGVQSYVGYKGYATLAMFQRGTIGRGLVREGDKFSFDLGTRELSHKFELSAVGREKKPILGSWAKVEFLDAAPLLVVMPFSLMQEKRTGHGDAWKYFPNQMFGKMPVIELGKEMPLGGYASASTMENAAAGARTPTWIDPDRGVMVDGTPHSQDQVQRIADTQLPVDEPELGAAPFKVIWPDATKEYGTIEQHRAAVFQAYRGAEDNREELSRFLERNKAEFDRIAEAGHRDKIESARRFFEARMDNLYQAEKGETDGA